MITVKDGSIDAVAHTASFSVAGQDAYVDDVALGGLTYYERDGDPGKYMIVVKPSDLDSGADLAAVQAAGVPETHFPSDGDATAKALHAARV